MNEEILEHINLTLKIDALVMTHLKIFRFNSYQFEIGRTKRIILIKIS